CVHTAGVIVQLANNPSVRVHRVDVCITVTVGIENEPVLISPVTRASRRPNQNQKWREKQGKPRLLLRATDSQSPGFRARNIATNATMGQFGPTRERPTRRLRKAALPCWLAG